MATRYVTLADDRKTHIYAESEFTKCGIPVPINAGAAWFESDDVPAKVCDACAAVGKTSEKAAKKATIYSTSDLGDISAANAQAPDAESA